MKLYNYNTPQSKDLRRRLRRNQTNVERLLWSKLRNKQLDGFKFFRQYGIGRYIVDCYCPKAKLVIELDGGQHNTADQRQFDAERTTYLGSKGIRVLRFWNSDINNNLEGVLEEIQKMLRT